jgi:hypothetical protein
MILEVSCHNLVPKHIKHFKKICSVLEGTLYSSISPLENGKDIVPTPQEWEGSYTYK